MHGEFLLTAAAFGGEQADTVYEILKILMDARRDGIQDLVGLVAIFLTLFVAIVSILGFFVYKHFKAQMDDHLHNRILEYEARTQISLGMAYYRTANEIWESSPESAHASLRHAINQTRQASRQLDLMKAELSSKEAEAKVNMKALSLTNAAYFLADLSELIRDPDNGLDEEEYEDACTEATKLANESALYVMAVANNRVVNEGGMRWWDVVESKLSALVRCDPHYRVSAAQERLQKLMDDETIPASWKDEIKQDWKKDIPINSWK